MSESDLDQRDSLRSTKSTCAAGGALAKLLGCCLLLAALGIAGIVILIVSVIHPPSRWFTEPPRIAGRVEDAFGRPISAGVTLSVRHTPYMMADDPFREFHETADAEGNFSFDKLDGHLREDLWEGAELPLTLSAPGYWGRRETIDPFAEMRIVLPRKISVTFPVVLPLGVVPGQIEARLRIQPDRPDLLRASFDAPQPGDDGWVFHRVGYSFLSEAVRASVPAGRMRLSLSSAFTGQLLWETAEFCVAEDRTFSAIDMRSFGVCRFSCREPSGQPSGAAVFYLRFGESWTAAKFSSEGMLTLINPRAQELIVVAPGCWFVSLEGPLTSRHLRLSRGAKISIAGPAGLGLQVVLVESDLDLPPALLEPKHVRLKHEPYALRLSVPGLYRVDDTSSSRKSFFRVSTSEDRIALSFP